MAQGQLYPGQVLREAPVVQDALFTYTKGLASQTPQVTTPAVAATTVQVPNTTGVNVFVYIAGGTVTVISVTNANGTSTTLGTTSGTAFLPAGGSIAITYSVAPTWVWQAM